MIDESVLISGSSGFIGTNLIQYLKKHGYISLNSVTRGKSTSRYTSFEISYEDLLTSGNHSYMHYIHLAGKAHDVRNTADEAEYIEVNYELTKRFYDRFHHDKNAKTFIFISSVKAVSDAPKGILTEKTEPHPLTAYGKSKLMAEKYILDHLPANKSVIILRPCMIHGPGNKGNLNLLYNIVSRGYPWPLGAYQNQRSFLSIENFCFVINKILQAKVCSGIYNISDDEPMSTNDLVKIISNINNKKERIWNISKTIIRVVAKTGNILPLPLNEERLQKLTEPYIVSNTKIKSELGTNLPLSAVEGFTKTILFYFSNENHPL